MKKSLLAGIDLPDLTKKKPGATLPGATPEQATGGLFIPLEDIEVDPDQPRKMSADADEDLKLLASSIVQHGVLQPITVKALQTGGYRIVAGERRWRAAKLALQSGNPCARRGYDLKRIPVFIRNPESDTDKLEMQMVENLARADMSSADIGTALQRLLNETGISKAELARRLGRSDTWVKAVLASASPEALAVANRIGVNPELIGAGESLRLISWSKDAEKQVVLDWIAADIRAGKAYSRALIDEAEASYEIRRRFPKMSSRTDLSLNDLKTWQALWDSTDPAQRAVADRVLKGASLAEAMAMQVPTEGTPPVEQGARSEEENATASPAPLQALQAATGATPFPQNYVPPENAEFDMVSNEEVMDAQAVREMLEPAGQFTRETRRTMDVAGMSMEAAGSVPFADVVNEDMTIRLPSRIIHRLLKKAGIAYDLTIDQDTLIQALDALLVE